MSKLKIEFGSYENSCLADEYTDASTVAQEAEFLASDLAEIMTQLWNDTGVQAAFAR